MRSSRQRTLKDTTHTDSHQTHPAPPLKKKGKNVMWCRAHSTFLRCIKLLSDREATLLHPDTAAGVKSRWTRVCVCCSAPVIMARWSWELKSSLALYLNPAAMSLTWTLRLERYSPAGHGTAQQRDPWLFNGRCQGRLPSKCFIFWPERMDYLLCRLRWMNFDKSNVG